MMNPLIPTRLSDGRVQSASADGVTFRDDGLRTVGNPPQMPSDAAPPDAVQKGISAYAAASTNTAGGDAIVEGGNGTGTGGGGDALLRPGLGGGQNATGAGGDIGAQALAGGHNNLARMGLPSRFNLQWIAGQRGKPGLNADLTPASADDGNDGATAAQLDLMNATDPDFEVLNDIAGAANTSSDDVTFRTNGGITFATDAGGTDSVVLLPHLASNQSAWGTVSWDTALSPRWECLIRTDADIADIILWAGLKLTRTSTTATDNDQAFFRFAPGVNASWQAIYSIAGTDTAVDTGVDVAANTTYHLVIEISATRVPTFYINGVLVATGTALTDTNLIPYIGVTESAGAVKTLHVFGQAMSQAYAA